MEILNDVRKLHKDALRDAVLMSTQKSSLLGGQPPNEVFVNESYVPLSVKVSDQDCLNGNEASETLESVISREFAAGTEGRMVLLCGGAGLGKTTAVEKLIWDWASGTRLQHYTLVLRLCVKALCEGELSLQSVLLRAHGHLSGESLKLALQTPHALLLVLDGLDHFQDLLEDSSMPLVCDPHQEAAGTVLLYSLLEGSLLPGVSLLLTTREAFPVESVQYIHIQGFSSSQRRMFFQQFFKDNAESEQILHRCEQAVGVMELCAVPAFCWTLFCVCKANQGQRGPFPETLTKLFGLAVQELLQKHRVKAQTGKKLLHGLGKLAEQGTSLSYKHSDLIKCGLHPFLGSPILSAFLHISEDDMTSPDAVFSFYSPVLKDFLQAASFYIGQDDGRILEELSGHYHVFLAGLSDPAQRKLLERSVRGFNSSRLSEFHRWLIRTVVNVLPGMDTENHWHVLRILHHTLSPTMVRESVRSCTWRLIGYGGIQEADCAALAFVVRCLGELQQLNLGMSELTEEQAEKLKTVFRLAKSINLFQSGLSVGVVTHLAHALKDGRATELNVSHSRLGDEGAKILFAAITYTNLHTLNLWRSDLTAACSETLAEMLSGSELGVLILGGNDLKDEGIIRIIDRLGTSTCSLQELCLDGCSLTGSCLAALWTSLSGTFSKLRNLNLRRNDLTDETLDLLSQVLQSGCCKLNTLSLNACGLTGSCCSALAAVLQSENCTLTDLDLSVNELEESGGMLICEALIDATCSMEKLSMVRCELTEPVFSALSTALISGVSSLKKLDIGLNQVGEAGAKHIWKSLKHPHCKLQHLDLEMLDLTDSCVDDLCEAVASCSSLTSIILKNNNLTDASVPRLVKLVQDRPALELNVQYNDFSEDVLEMMDVYPTIRY